MNGVSVAPSGLDGLGNEAPSASQGLVPPAIDDRPFGAEIQLLGWSLKPGAIGDEIGRLILERSQKPATKGAAPASIIRQTRREIRLASMANQSDKST